MIKSSRDRLSTALLVPSKRTRVEVDLLDLQKKQKLDPLSPKSGQIQTQIYEKASTDY